ncbi:MAG: aspartate--tRNA ligase, partial [Catalinimonas sp.]
MLRTHTCGELRPAHIGQHVTLTGWVQRVRDKGSVAWIDLRDRYGLTQLVMEEGVTDAALLEQTRALGREWVVRAAGEVVERVSKNPKLPTGEIEVRLHTLEVLNAAKVPPFLIEDDTDGGDDLRMRYRYLDLRRRVVRRNLELRHRLAQVTRAYLDGADFLEVETPVLIKSTPEGARDFVVPSRMNPGEFYALPQSPQTFKQLLMVSGFDRYFQIVKCFRDEDLRADRQPEFTQIDCEMAFVERDDVLETFEGLVRHVFQELKGITLPTLPRMPYDEAMRRYGNDKPDVRFGMELCDLTATVRGGGFKVFDDAARVVAVAAPGCADWTRKQLDALTDWVKRPQIGMRGLVWVKCHADGSFKSSVDKFFDQAALGAWAEQC